MSAAGRVLDLPLDPPPVLPASARAAGMLYVVLRDGDRPVGRLVLDPPYPDDATFATLARDVAREGRGAARDEPPADAPPPASSFAIVVATRDRPDDLDRCLEALAASRSRPGEVIVADSASSDGEHVRRVALRHGAGYVRCAAAGLSRARNTGAAAARAEIVAFLDDDCCVDPGYLDGLRRGFAEPAVQVVTGQLLPSEIETEAQRTFLRYAHMDRRGFVPRAFHRDRPESRHWPLDVWRVGSGGNVAARAATFRALGGFRLDLGLGTPALGGEDLFFVWSALASGARVVYRPDAMAWHRHHRSASALDRVLFGYGVGHEAYLAAARRAGASATSVAAYRLSFTWDRAKRLARAASGRWPVPPRLVVREIAGALAGPARARRARLGAGRDAA